MGLIDKRMSAEDEATETPDIDKANEAAEEQQGPENEQTESPDTDQADEGSEVDENNPAFKQALAVMRDVLYAQGAAKAVAKAVRSGDDVTTALSDTAYQMTVAIDDKTQGQVPDELVVALASEVLGEVADIAEAAGVKVTGKMIGEAMKMMILRYMKENGVDTTDVEGAMDKNINYDVMNSHLDKMKGGGQ